LGRDQHGTARVASIHPRILITASPPCRPVRAARGHRRRSGIVGFDGIFDASVTTKSKGMGIRLAVSRSIVEAHQGYLTASNNESCGATFSVVLPGSPVQTPHQEGFPSLQPCVSSTNTELTPVSCNSGQTSCQLPSKSSGTHLHVLILGG
jgi:hypothetical protein